MARATSARTYQFEVIAGGDRWLRGIVNAINKGKLVKGDLFKLEMHVPGDPGTAHTVQLCFDHVEERCPVGYAGLITDITGTAYYEGRVVTHTVSRYPLYGAGVVRPAV